MIEQIVGRAEQEREVCRSAKTYQDLQMALCQLSTGTAEQRRLTPIPEISRFSCKLAGEVVQLKLGHAGIV